MLERAGNFLIDLDHKMWKHIIYPFREWKCKRFGHRVYKAYGHDGNYSACKRGCGPV